MKAAIRGVAQSTAKKAWGRASSIKMAADAARGALAQADISYGSIDVFINVGVYRDANICEPAVASLIQQEIGQDTEGKPVFSFDLANGACGLINAFQVVASLVHTGGVRRALVVASDVDPTPRHSAGLDLEPVGVGIALAADEDEGFEAFCSDTYPQHEGLYDSHLRWIGPTNFFQKISSRGTQRIDLRQGPKFQSLATDCTLESLGRFLEQQELTFEDLDLVLTPGRPEGLKKRLEEEFIVGPDRIIGPDESLERAHTAAPGLALEAAIGSGRFSEARRTLVVAAGAGINVASALYFR